MSSAGRYSLFTRLFMTYGVAALLTLAVLPASHSASCGCGKRFGSATGTIQAGASCPACQFRTFINLSPAVSSAQLEIPVFVPVPAVIASGPTSHRMEYVEPRANAPPRSLLV